MERANMIGGKYSKYLVLAAIVLPLIFIAEVAYVERQPVKIINQEQTKEVAKLRAEAKTAWLSSQAAYVRGLANSSIVTADLETAQADFQSFLAAKTGFMALGYAGTDGKVVLDTSGARGNDISGHNYFTEAVAGREFTGQVSGTDWLLSEDVTIIALPVSQHGAVTGVVYGVIRQEPMDTMLAKLVPGTIIEPRPVDRWLMWLGVVYLLGIIPLLLLVYLLCRQQPPVMPKRAHKHTPAAGKYITRTPDAAISVFHRERPVLSREKERVTAEKGFADDAVATTPEAAIAIRKIAEIVAADQMHEQPDTPDMYAKPAVKPAATTPAAVIDRVLAVAAYNKGRAASMSQPNAPAKRVAAAPVEPVPMPELKQQSVIIAPVVSLPTSLPTEKALPGQSSAPDLPVYDTLTNTLTRSAFEKKITAQYGQSEQGIVVLSIDGMKVINDFLNTSAGDRLIKAAADILIAVSGSEYTVARVDGDQFAALLTAVSTDRLEEIKKDIKYFIDLHNLREPELPLSITVGTAMAKHGENWTAVWQRAARDMESHKAVNRVEARRFIMWSMKRYRRKS
ncbi:sensor domain-containing diguanylate cyclase [Sporomusa acidovorans]|uniref:GGDEF domain-containing protein n=1 Tax=Sporomusa acidovorans (strain ATCC 49682 / DSM 3132 / Mol) TaxID=1123286 RepID=A0ABZ3IWK8_SPOA4|nr:sensor domain-containing diguanylate cyclase [Sporomusa acidovorans]OZC23594.1 putative diguanylate cyclase YcdT [Sporomusa acidovorans DSM 3132]SDE21944.1 diguanylate cyclase (GGDEF) domain-containing protein [Sporomusa acidovorans]